MSSIRHTEAEFQSLLRRLELALDASHVGVWEHDLSRDLVTWDERMHKLYGTGLRSTVNPAEIWANALHPEDLERAKQEFDEAIRECGPYQSEFRIIWPNGEIKHIRSKATFYIAADGQPAFIGMEWDVTADVLLNRELEEQRRIAEERAAALQASQAQVEHAANHDYLTGLPNRRSFDRYCRAVADDDGIVELAVMHLDLDHFKEINDQRGHEAGDAILRLAARAITGACDKRDFAARMGGDEFILVCPNFGTESALRRKADAIMAAMTRGTRFRGDAMATSVSIGIGSSKGRDMNDLLKNSDLALYEAKRQGRGRVVFFHGGLTEGMPAAADHASEFGRALETGQILPVYQPQVCARDQKVIGLEALARWHHGSRGLLPAEDFVPLVRDSGMSAMLDRHMLDCVLRDIARWRAEGKSVPIVWMNLSEEWLTSPGFVEDLERRCIPSGEIGFELPMTLLFAASGGPALTNLRLLRQMGIPIAASRVGADDTSLLGLMRARPDRMKLDAQLVWPLTADQEQLQLLQGMVELGRTFGMVVTAEGVQSPEHAKILRQLGFGVLQGYGFGLPQPYAQVPLESTLLKRDLKG
jgi:diguanylate cyclase (GGDEF)-like protein/PAS domain S-box-containing protein